MENIKFNKIKLITMVIVGRHKKPSNFTKIWHEYTVYLLQSLQISQIINFVQQPKDHLQFCHLFLKLMAGKLGSGLKAVRHSISHGTIPEQDLQYWTNEDSQKPHIVSWTATKLLFRVQCHLLQSLNPNAAKTNVDKLSYLCHTTILTWLKHVSLFPAPFSSVTITL
jgi:hypothetical protein